MTTEIQTPVCRIPVTPNLMLLPLWHMNSVLYGLSKWKKLDNYFYLLKSKVMLFLFFKWSKSKFLPPKKFVRTVWTATKPEKYWNIRIFSKPHHYFIHLDWLDWVTLFWWADFLNVWEIDILQQSESVRSTFPYFHPLWYRVQ